MSRFRDQRGEFLERRACAHDGLHLDPMTQKHYVDQGDELPEEVVTAKTDYRCQAIDVRGTDRNADQRHHPGIPGSDLLSQADQERPAAVKIDHAGQGSQNVGVSGKEPLPAHSKRVLNHRRKGKYEHRQEQADPEAPSEIRDHSPMIVRGMTDMIAIRAVSDTIMRFVMMMSGRYQGLSTRLADMESISSGR